MVSRTLTQSAKMYIALAYLGGSATTSEIKACATSHGLKAARDWNVAATFNSGGTRVARVDGKWTLLPAGSEFVRQQGYSLAAAGTKNAAAIKKDRTDIVIGHGRSAQWRELKEWLRDHYDCKIHEFNSQSVVGVSHKERLQQLIDVADFAFIMMTAEDETAEGQFQARQNVVHEVGLFQGALGFENAVILLEEGCEEFSNIAGLGQIRFPKDSIESAFEKIRQYLKDRHGLA
jgi:predicted nucleotide-binding protein